MQSLHRSILVFLGLGLGTLASCGGGGGGGGGSPPPDLSGTISVFSSSGHGGGVVLEDEPNDDLARAQLLGAFPPGRSLTLRGDADAESDPIDAFRLTASERVRLDVRVELANAGALDADLLVYDTTSSQIVESFSSIGASGGASIEAKGSLLLVLCAHGGSSAYSLSIRAARPAEPLVAGAGATRYLGELLAGESVVVRGSSRESRLLLAFPENVDLEAELALASDAESELAIQDATAGLSIAAEVTRVRGSVPAHLPGVPAMSLLAVEVHAGASPAAWELTLRAREPAQGVASVFAAPRALAPLTEETAWLRGRVLDHPIGTVELQAVAGEAIVRPREGVAVASLLAHRGAHELVRSPSGVTNVAIDLPSGLSDTERMRATLAWIDSVSADGSVLYAEPNFVYRVLGEPNDPHYHLQWHYKLIQLPAAWDTSKGSASVIVAVVDTGKTQHPDLAARQIAGYDLISSASNADDGDGIDPDATDEGDGSGGAPSSFHGTHVAGTIAALTNNHVGVAGVTWMGKVMHVRALGKEGGTVFDISNAILFAAGLDNSSGALPAKAANVINMSIGGPGFSQTMFDAITAAKEAGLVLCAAAGNENSSEPSYPAAYDGVISVAAVDALGDKAPYSNFHATVDVAAPGGDLSVDSDADGYPDGVLSTLFDEASGEFVYAFYEGTSMACPHVAGVAALMLAIAPGLGPNQIENMLESTAVDRGAAGKDPIYGHGLINAAAAVNLAAGGGSTTPILGLGSQTVVFDVETDEREIAVFNVGGGMLAVEAPVVSTVTGGDWLAAVRVPSTTSDSSDTDAIRISVVRTGLAEGTYTGDVLVPSNGGDLNIDVTLEVGPEQVGDDVDIFVIVLNPETFETVGETVVNPTTTLVYSFADLPPGDYEIFAGSDDNGDGFICGENDVFCGAWPTMSDPGLFTIVDGTPLANIDFVVSSGTGTASNGDRRGIRRMP
jgi:subtilisin family serine protease